MEARLGHRGLVEQGQAVCTAFALRLRVFHGLRATLEKITEVVVSSGACESATPLRCVGSSWYSASIVDVFRSQGGWPTRWQFGSSAHRE